ncbi:isochorismatase family cysteine hydrolase [Granulicella sibirica]|uniref:Isochorismatase n=1 Tax=Granulicella sibirica TaxID=2479048 RepID=A0A4V1L5D4_9BACT|nr:isochorismatase family cysteine hydrolase [Granulicella sibirica]RXH55374.1 Isochorismatase [Granulicella sibirica]
MSFYAKDSTALLIVDPYNDFMSEGGKLYDITKPQADSVSFYENMRKLIPAVRAAGIKVFIVPHHRTRPTDFADWAAVNPTQQDTFRKKCFEEGAWGGEFHPEFGPKPGDVIALEHWAQNGFAGTDLDAQLKQHGRNKLIFVGFIANSCVESSARMGMELGYHVTLIKDAVGAFNPEGMVAARVNAKLFAHSELTTDELLEALQVTAKA